MTNTGFALTDPLISIGTLARRVGLSVSAIRKYESEGLVIAHRTASGHRMFSHEDIDRVMIIHHLIRNVGLNMEGIRRLLAMLPCWELSSEDKDSAKPCWVIRGAGDPGQAERCRVCAVYRFGSQCTQDIKEIVFGGKVPVGGEAVVELIRRRRVS
jgi:MerR family transcriptional regulator/heat shock protein HspR